MSDANSLARRMAADQAERRWARRKVQIWWVVGIVLFIAFIIGGKQTYHWAKRKRAAQFDDLGDQYMKENLAPGELKQLVLTAFHDANRNDPLKPFSEACRRELANLAEVG